jgi:hypothetical protein
MLQASIKQPSTLGPRYHSLTAAAGQATAAPGQHSAASSTPSPPTILTVTPHLQVTSQASHQPTKQPRKGAGRQRATAAAAAAAKCMAAAAAAVLPARPHQAVTTLQHISKVHIMLVCCLSDAVYQGGCLSKHPTLGVENVAAHDAASCLHHMPWKTDHVG